MSWDNITGDAKIIPTSGNANEIILESGKAKVVRLLLPNGQEPYSYFEHCIEVEVPGANGQMEKQFRTTRCPKTSKNPNAHCDLCDGQQARRRVRHACNVWDFESGSVQKLNQGVDVFSPFATTRKLGVDILGVNWAILRTGTDRNDTKYSATNIGNTYNGQPVDFHLPENTQLFNIENEYAPHSNEEARAIVESIGADWNKFIVPPALVYPTLQEALAHKMPNGKYKEQTMEQIWNADKSPRGMINFLATKSDRVTAEKAAAQVILVALGGANIPGVVVNTGNGETPTPNATQTTTQTPTTTTQQAPVQPPVQGAVGGKQDKINKINVLFSTKDAYTKGGYKVVIEAMQKAGNGKTNIVDFSDAELDALLAICENA